MAKFVAFLRGINVGGTKKVPMAQLKQCFEDLGFEKVRTFLNSGNVVFEGKKSLIGTIQKHIETYFGFSILTFIIPFEVIENIVSSNPFKKIKYSPSNLFYITFLKEPHLSKMKIPREEFDGSFTIMSLTNESVCSFLDKEKISSIQGMDFLELEFGKNITTRNYNTLVKIVTSYQEK